MSKLRQFRRRTGFLKEKRRVRLMRNLRKDFPISFERDWAYYRNTKHNHKKTQKELGIKTRREVRSNLYLKELKEYEK